MSHYEEKSQKKVRFLAFFMRKTWTHSDPVWRGNRLRPGEQDQKKRQEDKGDDKGSGRRAGKQDGHYVH